MCRNTVPASTCLILCEQRQAVMMINLLSHCVPANQLFVFFVTKSWSCSASDLCC